MARKGENIYQRKDGRWEARFIKGHDETGKAVYKSVYAHSYMEVKEKRQKALDLLSQRDYPDQADAGKVKAVAESWLSFNEKTWKASTLARYREKVNAYIIPVFGDREFSEISTEEVNRLITLIQTEGLSGRKPVSPSTASMVMTVIRELKIYAQMTDCKVRFSADCIRVKRGGKPDITVFSEKEEKRLVSHLREDTDETDVGVLTSLFTGMRVGEVCALNCDDIDLEEDILHVRHTLQRIPVIGGSTKTAVVIGSPKSDSSIRDIPITKDLKEVLQPFYRPGTYLLTGDREKTVEPRTMENRFAGILKRCGMKQVNYHTTRHTFATRCVERGMDPKTLSEILGHSSVATTLDYYVHLSMKQKAEGLELLSDLFSV